MNIFSQLITAFCASCIFIGALLMICPDGAVSKSVKYVLALAFLLSVMAATGITVKKADFKIKMPETQQSDTAALDAASAKYVYAYALTKAGINFKEITVCTDKDENGSIIISKIIIYSDCESTRIKQALGEAAQNYEVEIINE